MKNIMKNYDYEIIKISSTDFLSKFEILVKIIRKSVIIEFNEDLKIVEGELTSVTSNKLTLKTVDMESVFDIGIKIKQELDRERVNVGDIIKIYKESEFICRIGWS